MVDVLGRHAAQVPWLERDVMADTTSEKSRGAASSVSAGERIKALRRSRGWTQDQLAQATGVSRSAVAQWETGRAGFGAKARLIAEALDVPVRQLQPGFYPDPPMRLRDPTPISNDELVLLRHFRELDSEDQACVMQIAGKLANLITQRGETR